jgi:hypothetical protein
VPLANPTRHAEACPLEAQRLELGPQGAGIATARVPALGQVLHKGIDQLAAGRPWVQGSRWPAPGQIRPDGVRRNPELTRDLSLREAFRQPF